MLYAMQTSCIPITVLNRIQNKIRAFFWNKGSDRRMPLVAWRKITQPKTHGGLGLKDMVLFARTVTMKNLWGLLVGSDATWARIMTAKYLTRTDLWSIVRTRKCTAQWRALMSVREDIKEQIHWCLGNGQRCRAMGQPWFQMWGHYIPANANQRRLTDLTDPQGGGWNTERLIQVFDFYGALFIATHLPNPNLRPNSEDRLVFKYATNGKFTIGGAYRMLAQQSITDRIMNEEALKIPTIMPKSKVFLWKALHNGLPVDEVISSRIQKNQVGFLNCGMEETVHHMLFQCNVARQVWLASSVGLISNMLPSTPNQAIPQIWHQMDHSVAPLFAATAWFIWRNRCTKMFEGTSMPATQVNRNAIQMMRINLRAHLPACTI